MYTFLDKRMIKNVICEKPRCVCVCVHVCVCVCVRACTRACTRALKELWEGGQ